jgi:hypothetical protein
MGHRIVTEKSDGTKRGYGRISLRDALLCKRFGVSYREISNEESALGIIPAARMVAL